MRWKRLFLIIVLSAILSHNKVQSSEDDIDDYVESVETNNDEYDVVENNKNEPKTSSENNKVSTSPPAAPPPPAPVKSVVSIAPNTSMTLRKASATGERSGKYMDYPYMSNYDLNDQNYDWNDPNNRYAPSEPATHQGDGYVITAMRLKEIRERFLYPFHDRGGSDEHGDYQKDIHHSNPQVHKNFNFQLPFFGFRFNYTRVSMNGFLEFSDPPEHYTYPLSFPVKDWPKKNDPSFIGIFHSKCRIGKIHPEDQDQRMPGVYFRMERDLESRKDRYGVEMRERVMWDIREGVVGSDTFVPKHVAIVTWKNMSFAGGIDNSLYNTNSFQMVLATDEVYTYAIFNYIQIRWSSHTEAGGDTTGGEGGVPAFIGFNAGNGTQAYEYVPYSQSSVLRDLTGRGWANSFPGRHIFRIDEKIMLGTCNKDIDAAHLPLVFAPESGNMLGGTVVNITGPCFDTNERVSCRFDTEEVIGHVIDRNRAICVQPFLKAQGYVRFEISIGTERYKWRGKFFVETPAHATERIFFDGQEVHQKAPREIKITWNKYNLTTNLNANVRVSLWGYRETTIRPELLYIDLLEESIMNTGHYTINPENYRLKENPTLLNIEFGFIQINLTNPEQYSGLKISPVLWSKPIPLGWYFGPQWERKHGKNWPRALCDNWIRADRYLKNFAAELPICPCKLEHALFDKGRFMPDPSCDIDSNPSCIHHKGAIHCVRTGQPSYTGSEQQCCYDRNKYLMLSYDQMWGSRVRKVHDIGQMPWNEAGKVPTLSQWFHDVKAYYSCCMWQDEQAVGCETFRFERRPSQDCIAYQPPAVAAVFGDPHIVTFDNLQYTFNGMGEFVLVKANNGKERLEVQARFEQVPRNIYGQVMATKLTSIAIRGNTSTVIEVRVRPKEAQWRYHLDVFADEKRIYFDRESLRKQYFHGVTVYTPPYVLNQSEIVVMLSSGAGVEVVENGGHMTARVYLPWSFINKTRGLFGNWSWDVQDDLTLPDGQVVGINLNNFESIHRDFAMKWMLADRSQDEVGGALFVREFGKTSSHYTNETFLPNFLRDPREFLPSNRTQDIERAYELCGDSYQCKFDYGMSLDREMAYFTKNYYSTAINIKTLNSERMISCGILETPRFGRKTNFMFTPGTRVSFECNEGFTLVGDMRRECTAEGHWDTPIYGYTTCLRNVYYTQQTVWKTIGFIFAVILPILLFITCVVYCWRKRHLKEDPDWKMPIPSRSASRSTLRNIGSDADDDTIKKVRNYDGSYKTHEPLNGKPVIEFPQKKLDLDEDDLDVTSSEGGSEYKDKVAKDFEYRNSQQSGQNDEGRVLGRRAERQQAIQEEDLDLTQQPSSSNNNTPMGYNRQVPYSPSYSQNDRDSFMTDPSQSPPVLRQQQQPPNQFYYATPASPPPIGQSVGLPTASPTNDGARSTQV